MGVFEPAKDVLGHFRGRWTWLCRENPESISRKWPKGHFRSFLAIFGQTAFLTPSFLCIIRFSTLQKPLVRASTTQIRPFWGVFWRFRRHVRLPDRSGRCPKLKWRFLSRGASELENSFAFMHLRLLGRLSRAKSIGSDRGRICTCLLCRVRRPRHISLTLSHVKSCVCVCEWRKMAKFGHDHQHYYRCCCCCCLHCQLLSAAH